MAYREKLTDLRTLKFFAPSTIIEAVEEAIGDGRKVEMEFTDINDLGPDESRVMIDDIKLFTIPGY